MPCKYITNMYAQEYAQEPLKCMVVSMSFHGDAWSIDASVREVLQCHGCHQLPCMEFMIGSCIITKMSCDAMMDCAVPSTWYEAKQSCQKNAKLRHPIEQVLILRSFADFCARFAEFCARFARPPFHIFSSFTHRSCKLATCSHPVQGHNGAAILTDEPSNCKPPAMKGLHMFASAHPGRPFMIACHESGTLVWGWSRMYVHTYHVSVGLCIFQGHVGKQFLVRKLEL